MDTDPLMSSVLAQLRVDLATTQREAHKLETQLTCLIQLVRRAWLGDSGAASDVAKIVGIAPPDINIQRLDEEVSVTVKPKEKVLNNWVLLTVGLLNRQYRDSQNYAAAYQNGYLMERNEYLNDQIKMQHDGVKAFSRVRPTSAKAMVSQETKSKQVSSPPSRPPTGKRRVTHIYSTASNDDTKNKPGKDSLESALTWGDLLGKGYQKGDDEVQQALLKKTEQRQKQESPERLYRKKRDLYEMEALNDNLRGPSPVRAKSVHGTRPKSSFICVTNAESAEHVVRGHAPLQRPRTANVSRQPQKPVYTSFDLTAMALREATPDLAIKCRPVVVPPHPRLGRTLSEELRRDFDREIHIEQEFRKTASHLQKKLGITLDGMI